MKKLLNLESSTVVYVFICLLFIYLLAFSVGNFFNDDTTQNNEPIEDNSTIINNKHKNNSELILKNIDKLGYLLEETNCRDTYSCYYKDGYQLEYDINSYYDNVILTKKIDIDNLNNYDSSNELDEISKIYSKNISSNSIDIINSLIHNLDKSENYFTVKNDNLWYGIYISKYDSTIKYRVNDDYGKYNDKLNPLYIDSFIQNTKDFDKIYYFYDLSMKYNKDHFKYEDYFKYITGKFNTVCSVEYLDNGYYFNTDICHGGTSNIYFRFDYKDYATKKDEIVVDLGSKDGKFLFKEVINENLSYFNHRLDKGYELDDKDYEIIESVVNYDGNYKSEITIDDLIIKIAKKYAGSYLFQTITFTFKENS